MIDHYYHFLSGNLDNNVICQTMLKLELMSEEDLVDSAKIYSNYQKNAFLLDQLLVTDASNIVSFAVYYKMQKMNKKLGICL